MPGYRVPILVNGYEREVDEQLDRLCQRFGARLFSKVGVKDVLPIRDAGLVPEDRSYAFMAHVDFVVTDENHEALLAVEFDGGQHQTDPKQIARDERKNRICHHFMLPLLRVGAPALRKTDHRTLLEWIVEVVFVQRQLCEAKQRHEESDGEEDPPDVDPRKLDYREYGKVRKGLDARGPLDAFAEARAAISRFCWRSPVTHPGYEGWHGEDAEGRTVGHLALEVESGKWIVATGRCNLRSLWIWTDAIFPPTLAQDLALLSLVRQLDEWQLGQRDACTESELQEIVKDARRGLFAWPNLPNHREQTDAVLSVLRGWGIDTDDPHVWMNVRESLRCDDESDEDYWDRMHELEREEERREQMREVQEEFEYAFPEWRGRFR